MYLYIICKTVIMSIYIFINKGRREECTKGRVVKKANFSCFLTKMKRKDINNLSEFFKALKPRVIIS